MAVVGPPFQLVRAVERITPGVYGAFWTRLVPAATSGTRVTSYYRDLAENARVSGARDSQHLIGLAIDLTDPDPQTLEWRLDRSGLTAIRFAGHVHVQLWPAGTARRIGLLDALGL